MVDMNWQGTQGVILVAFGVGLGGIYVEHGPSSFMGNSTALAK